MYQSPYWLRYVSKPLLHFYIAYHRDYFIIFLLVAQCLELPCFEDCFIIVFGIVVFFLATGRFNRSHAGFLQRSWDELHQPASPTLSLPVKQFWKSVSIFFAKLGKQASKFTNCFFARPLSTTCSINALNYVTYNFRLDTHIAEQRYVTGHAMLWAYDRFSARITYAAAAPARLLSTATNHVTLYRPAGEAPPPRRKLRPALMPLAN